MERTFESLYIYTGKIGIDNFLLMVIGVLYFCVYWQDKTLPHPEKIIKNPKK